MIIIIKVWIYLCIFIACENLVYGFMHIFDKSVSWDARKYGVMASYIWMIPSYLIFPILFDIIVTSIPLHGWWMLFFIPTDFAIGFLLPTLFESLTGFILFKTIGACPWGIYSTAEKGIFGGYSRWDWSLSYGVIAIFFHGFIILLNEVLK